jgi:3-isopropylmalate dehydrogenase
MPASTVQGAAGPGEVAAVQSAKADFAIFQRRIHSLRTGAAQLQHRIRNGRPSLLDGTPPRRQVRSLASTSIRLAPPATGRVLCAPLIIRINPDPTEARSMPKVAVVPGDGVGKEVTREAVKALQAVTAGSGLELDLVEWPHGADRYLETGEAITDAEFDDLRSNYQAILLGALGDARVPGNEHARQILLGMRFKLDLYVNFRPVRLFHERLTPLRDKRAEDVDMVIFRENTEGVYVGMGGTFKQGTPDEVAIQEDVNTRKGVERIIRAAFEWARVNGKTRVTMSDKSNAMEFAGGLWRRVFKQVSAEYAEIESEAAYVDMLAMDLVRRPERYQVIVTGNLFGDILSDLGAQLAGGLGLSPSGNIHPGRIGLFEPVHGSAPDLAGRDLANPFAAVLTAGLMLEHLGRPELGKRLENAVRDCIVAGETTPDLDGTLGTAAAGDAVVRRLRGA